jgi:hypothetical protein
VIELKFKVILEDLRIKEIIKHPIDFIILNIIYGTALFWLLVFAGLLIIFFNDNVLVLIYGISLFSVGTYGVYRSLRDMFSGSNKIKIEE